MKAYKGVVENGVVVVLGARLPEGTAVTVTVGEGELLRATLVSVLGGGTGKLGKKIKIRLRPLPGLSTELLIKLAAEKLALAQQHDARKEGYEPSA